MRRLVERRFHGRSCCALLAFYSIRSERQLAERLEFDLLFRWSVGLGIDDPAWNHSVFSKNRDRLLECEIAAKFLAAILTQPRSSGCCIRCTSPSTARSSKSGPA
jgi:hypothetical protein